MKKQIVMFCIASLLLIAISSCAMEQVTPENPFGITDPNQVQLISDVGVSTGQTIQAVGAASGNSTAVGLGAAIAIISGWLTTIVLGKDKKNGTTK